jgi:predicted acetyltransferase
MADDAFPRELTAVLPKHRDVLVALLDEYIDEMSGYQERPLGATKGEEYRYLDAYFGEPGRHAFLVCVGGEVAGFALIRGPESTGTRWHVAEFYVTAPYRRSGVGRWAMTSIWKRFPGSWELQVHATNAAAIGFWAACARASGEEEPIVTAIEAPDGRRWQYEFRVAPRTYNA